LGRFPLIPMFWLLFKPTISYTFILFHSSFIRAPCWKSSIENTIYQSILTSVKSLKKNPDLSLFFSYCTAATWWMTLLFTRDFWWGWWSRASRHVKWKQCICETKTTIHYILGELILRMLLRLMNYQNQHDQMCLYKNSIGNFTPNLCSYRKERAS
jgi:hypothetical protein